MLLNSSVPKSYYTWSKLDEFQQRKVLNIYLSLTDQQKRDLITEAGKFENPIGTSTNTTKNDLVRLLDMRMYPSFQTTWTKALGPLQRTELDAKNSHESEERDHEINAWNILAENFNTRSFDILDDSFRPYNRVLLYDDITGMPKKPYVSSDPNLYSPSVVKMLKDMDPNEKDRPFTYPSINSEYTMI